MLVRSIWPSTAPEPRFWTCAPEAALACSVSVFCDASVADVGISTTTEPSALPIGSVTPPLGTTQLAKAVMWLRSTAALGVPVKKTVPAPPMVAPLAASTDRPSDAAFPTLIVALAMPATVPVIVALPSTWIVAVPKIALSRMDPADKWTEALPRLAASIVALAPTSSAIVPDPLTLLKSMPPNVWAVPWPALTVS